jgi:hypothetical protein
MLEAADRALFEQLDDLIDRLADAPEPATSAERIRALHVRMTRLDAVLASEIVRFDRRQEHTCHRAKSATAWLRRALRVSGAEAARLVRRARQTDAMAIVQPLWLDGQLGTQQVDQLSIARRRGRDDESFAEHEARFARTALTARPEELQSELAQWVDAIEAERHDPSQGDGESWSEPRLHLSTLLDRVGVLDALLDAEGTSIVGRAIDNEYRRAHRAGDERTPAHQRADALVAICRRSLEHTARGHQRPHLLVHTDLPTLRGDSVGRAETDTGLRLSPATVQRLACDATVQWVVRSADGATLDLGRATRTFTLDQRRALLAMYPTCVHPECAVPAADADLHHLVPWASGGASDLTNGVPLCWHHHDDVHHGRVRFVRRPDGRIDAYDRFEVLIGTTTPRPPITPIRIRRPEPPPSADDLARMTEPPDLACAGHRVWLDPPRPRSEPDRLPPGLRHCLSLRITPPQT